MSAIRCIPCCALDVAVPNDFDYGYLLYPTQPYSFVLDCPSDLYCPTGYFPVTVTISDIPPVIVQTGATTLWLQGCSSLITATVPAGANAAQIAAIAAGMQQQWAYQQAWCNVRRNIPKLPKTVRLATGCAQANYSQSITPLKGSGPYSFVIISGILPFGLSLTQTGPTTAVIAGVTNELGTFYFTVRGTNLSAEFSDVTYSVGFLGIVNISGLTSGTQGSPYSFQLNGDGGIDPYTFGIASGALPGGVTLSGTGLISGTPTVAGIFNFTVKITDSAGSTCSTPVTLTVIPPPLSVPLLYWTMDEAVAGNRIDSIRGAVLTMATSPSPPVGVTSGIIGNAALLPPYLPGYNDGVLYLENSTLVHYTGSGLSIALWVKLSGAIITDPFFITGFFILGDWALTSVFSVCGVNLSDSNQLFVGYNNNVLVLNNSPTLDQWYFVTITYNGTNKIRCYLDGVFTSSMSLSPSLYINPWTNGRIGLQSYQYGQSVIVDEFGYWDAHILSDYEIAYLYNSGASRRPPFA